MRKQERKIAQNFTYLIKEHVQNNIKEYLIISIIFLIGIVLGVFFYKQYGQRYAKSNK